MKKIPQPDDKSVSAGEQRSSSAASSGASTQEPALPLLPGTEEPRSLGELMREAEAGELKQQSLAGRSTDLPDDENSNASASSVSSSVSSSKRGDSKKARRSKRPSRAQSRRFARERALQALYQWDVSAAQSSIVRQEFMDTQDMSRVDVDYFALLYNGVSHNPEAIDAILLDCLDRPMNDLDPVERAVLRIAAFELSQQKDIPARVVINEGIEITKRFGADKGHHYVNGVLDKLAMTLRASEMKPR